MGTTVGRTMYAILSAVPIENIEVMELMNGDKEASCTCAHCWRDEWYPLDDNIDAVDVFEEWAMFRDVVLCDVCSSLVGVVEDMVHEMYGRPEDEGDTSACVVPQENSSRRA
jgi:hypothetical protein